MRIVWPLVFILACCVVGYAYYKDPSGCQKLAADVASDTMAIASAITPPYFSPSPSAPLTTTNAPPTPTTPPNATATDTVQYPMGYVAKIPASTEQPATVATPAAPPAPAIVRARPALGSFSDYDQALAAARQDNAPMLILFTGSDWCPYCQKLEQEVLSTRDFTNYVSGRYVFLTIDDLRNTPVPDSTQAEIKQLEQKYAVTGFPTLMVVTSDEKEKGREAGYDPGSGPAAVISQLDQIAAK